MVQDHELTKAVAGIPQRSEKQSDLQKLIGAFVDVGILPQVDNINSQIIYGRRGTGKTHVLRVLASQLSSRPRSAVVYVDARTLGSTSQFTDTGIPLPTRCTALFRDLLGEIYNGLLEFIVEASPSGADNALDELTQLANVSTKPYTSVLPESVTDKRSEEESDKAGLEATFSPSSLGVRGRFNGEQTSKAEHATEYRVEHSDKIVFPAVSSPGEAHSSDLRCHALHTDRRMVFTARGCATLPCRVSQKILFAAGEYRTENRLS